MDRKLCFIFDLDGTLLDSIRVYNLMFTQTIPSHFNRELKREKEEIMKKQVLKLIQGKASKYLGVKLLWWYGKELGLGFFKRFKLLSVVKKEYNRLIPQTPLYEGVEEAIRKIVKRGHLVAINTSSSREELEDKFPGEKRKFLEYFGDLIVTRSDVTHLKPHPESIEIICTRSGIPVENMIMVGDMEMDIVLGKNAGCRTVLVLSGFLTQEDLTDEFMERVSPDWVFSDVSEMVEHLNEIEENFQKE